MNDRVQSPPLRAFSNVTVGVGNLDEALDLWVGTFGLEKLAAKQGDDLELARLWGIEDNDVRRQALVGTPGQSTGRIHFVEFADPGPSVRAGAEAFDSCPKNLDIYVDDMPRQIESLKHAGHVFRHSDYGEITAPNGNRVREIHLPAHDDVNIVLLQMLDEEVAFSPLGFSGIGPVITIVPDARPEMQFYSSILGLELVDEHTLRGPQIETMIGLPTGSELHFSIWGHSSAPFGRVEVVAYSGVNGSDLFSRATPKSRGILHVSYEIAELQGLRSRLEASATPYTRHGKVSTLASSGETISFRSPAGFRIEAVQSDRGSECSWPSNE